MSSPIDPFAGHALESSFAETPDLTHDAGRLPPPPLSPTNGYDNTGADSHRMGRRRSPSLVDILLKVTFLSPYGRSGMTPIARKNLATAALLLIVLWCIDSLAWSGLWNLLLSGGLMNRTGATPLAIVLGLGIATGILSYESNFMSTNFRTARRPKVSMAIRIALILGMAVTTAVPVDLYLLQDEIALRIHQQQVLAELPGMVHRWSIARRAVKGDDVTDAVMKSRTVDQRDELERATLDRTQQAQNVAAAHTSRARADAAVRELQARIANLDPSSAAARDLRSELQRAQQVQASAVREEGAAGARLARAQRSEQSANVQLKKAISDAELERVTDYSALAQRYENWFQRLWASPPETNQVEDTVSAVKAAPMEYHGSVETSAGIGARMVALGEVLAARHPRRPPLSREGRRAVAEMGLAAYVEDDPNMTAELENKAASLRRLNMVVSLLFCAVPFLVLAQKFNFDVQVEHYFSIAYQRQIGCPGLPEEFRQATSAPSPILPATGFALPPIGPPAMPPQRHATSPGFPAPPTMTGPPPALANYRPSAGFDGFPPPPVNPQPPGI